MIEEPDNVSYLFPPLKAVETLTESQYSLLCVLDADERSVAHVLLDAMLLPVRRAVRLFSKEKFVRAHAEMSRAHERRHKILLDAIARQVDYVWSSLRVEEPANLSERARTIAEVGWLWHRLVAREGEGDLRVQTITGRRLNGSQWTLVLERVATVLLHVIWDYLRQPRPPDGPGEPRGADLGLSELSEAVFFYRAILCALWRRSNHSLRSLVRPAREKAGSRTPLRTRTTENW